MVCFDFVLTWNLAAKPNSLIAIEKVFAEPLTEVAEHVTAMTMFARLGAILTAVGRVHFAHDRGPNAHKR